MSNYYDQSQISVSCNLLTFYSMIPWKYELLDRSKWAHLVWCLLPTEPRSSTLILSCTTLNSLLNSSGVTLQAAISSQTNQEMGEHLLTTSISTHLWSAICRWMPVETWMSGRLWSPSKVRWLSSNRRGPCRRGRWRSSSTCRPCRRRWAAKRRRRSCLK